MRTIAAGSIAALALFLAAPASAQTPWTAAGELQDGDAQGDEGRRYDDHRVRLEAGQRYRLTVNSEAFDPVARLYRPGAPPGDETKVAENDDSSESLNSRIVYIPSETGDFVLRVTGFAADARGAYTAEAATLPPPPPPITTPGTPLAASGTWLEWLGDLGDADPDQDGHRYDDYLIRIEAGQRRYISLEAEGFDTIVQILRPEDRGGETPQPLDTDDDAGVGFNSLLAFAPEAAGDYIVRVTSFEQNASGPYRLLISR
jgi:hypothetical protein